MEMEPLVMTPVREVQMTGESHLGETLPEPEVKTFGEYLTDALSKTNQLQKESDALNAALAAGEVEDISQVVVASAKADLALKLTLQVRNRAVQAYQELMRMQV